MDKKAVILLSGGLDSVYNLYAAHKKWGDGLLALVFNYGQKAWEKENQAAHYFAEDLRVRVQVTDITKLFLLDKSSLTSTEKNIPTDQVDIESFAASQESAKSVWVANRNGVFLNIAACLAESVGASFIVPGFNAEEAATFPDNSVEYIEKMNACLKMSTSNQVQIYCFSQSMDKKQIVQECRSLGVETQKIWSCYHAGESLCRECESCQRFLRAIGD